VFDGSELAREKMLWNIPVGVVDLGIGAEKLLLARLVGVVPTDLVAVRTAIGPRYKLASGRKK
jgi:hypothetical protein